MSRLQSIENGLIEINETVFQELCDGYLAMRNENYTAFSRTGSQSGKQKTRKGTPDSFFLLSNGKYIFVEYSTNITSGVKKLGEDIQKCLDEEKTGVPISDIAEIILCINFNLKASEIQELKELLSKTKIILTMVTLNSLAIELHLNHRDLANQYLGLPLDTGQIVSIGRFIEEYNRASNRISTPLDNKFLHRENEVSALKSALADLDFIILTGAPGVGKTKLAIETIKEFVKENKTFNAFCVSYKNHTLLEDLFHHLKEDKDYILFVDDANRIDSFDQIKGFYRSSRKGKLKIVITVRDYALQEIDRRCNEFLPQHINVPKLNDEQIIDIIKADSFEILNSDYQREIVRIADGNPRLAIMAALLAKQEQNLEILSDASDLFEIYFSTFIQDQAEFVNDLHIRCLGLIAFFYTIPYKDKELVTNILSDFEINYYDFIDAIDKLDKWELIEIQFEHVKIPEQNLSTYFFYRSFIKDNLLSFGILLKKYFDANEDRFRECIISANNTFGPKNVMTKLKSELIENWNTIKSDEKKAYKFLSIFWIYLENQSLEFVYDKIADLPVVGVEEYKVEYKNNAFSYNRNEIIELLGEFFRPISSFKDAIELAFEFTRKYPQHLPELIHKIREVLTFDRDDEITGYYRQEVLFDLLLRGLNEGDQLYSTAFYELAKTFLEFQFHHSKGGRNYTVYWYDYQLRSIKPIQEFRAKIWHALDTHFTSNPNKTFEVLQSYLDNYKTVKEIMEFDIPFILGIIDKYFTNESFDNCRYVQDYIRQCKRNSVLNPIFPSLIEKFTNSTYERFLKIDWNRLRDKEVYQFEDWKEYERLKEAEIRSSFTFHSKEEIKIFYDDFVYLKDKIRDNWSHNKVMDIVIEENCLNNFELGMHILQLIIKENNIINYIPRAVFYNQLNTQERVNQIWGLMLDESFQHKIQWEFAFFENIHDSLINQEIQKAIMNSISATEENVTIYFDGLEKFLKIQPNLFEEMLKTIVEKNSMGVVKLYVLRDVFIKYFDKLGDDIGIIKEAYLQQNKLSNHFDYDGKGLLNILKTNPSFLVDFVNTLYNVADGRFEKEKVNLSCIWEIENIENQLIRVFDEVIEKEFYLGILEHFCNNFFRDLKDTHQLKADRFLLSYVKSNYNNQVKMNVVVDIVRNSRTELLEKVLLSYLSLNQSREAFSKIYWIKNGGVYSADVIFGDVEAAEWRTILSIVEKATLGIKLIPIKRYLAEKIENCLKSGEYERKRRFLQKN
ncbi:NB-ARC domain protein [Bacillus cereus]|uniref:nSTAND3 domain-containing NTPase n=1 Tax=Bacillus cereus group TaxID=86661 RepID=UPI000A3018FD|nr:ATP-binding protein [Bacillus cereus]SME73858.1 NB-ARC domain protein [Bacillus cereus]